MNRASKQVYFTTDPGQSPVDGGHPFLHVPAFHITNKRLELYEQRGVSLKIIVVELHPVTKHIQHSEIMEGGKRKGEGKKRREREEGRKGGGG